MNNKQAFGIAATLGGIQFVVSFCYLSLFLMCFEYLTERGFSFVQVVLIASIITTFFRVMRMATILYSAPESNP